MATKTVTYPASESGYWKPELSKAWRDATEFLYIPGQVQAVNEDVLKAMIADGVIVSAVAV